MRNAIAAFSVLALSGCASIVSKSDALVGFRSTPPDATVEVINKAGVSVFKGVTPTSTTLSKRRGFFQGETYAVVYTKPNFDDQRFILDTQVSGWYFGNILLGGLIGMLIVDPATGAMWSFDRDGIDANLIDPKAAAKPVAPPTQ